MEEHRTLMDLPAEILILLVELGPLDISDAFALRQTCRLFFGWSQNHYFWSVVIRNSTQMGRPPPVPSFRLLRDLPENNLKDLCIRHLTSTANLSKPQPSHKSHRTITLSSTSVGQMAFLPGGDVLILAYNDGDLELWEIGGDPGRFTFGSKVKGGNSIRGDPCRLATHATHPIFDYETEGATESTLNIVTTWIDEDTMSTRLSVFRLEISIEDMTANYEMLGGSMIAAVSLSQFNIRNRVVVGVYCSQETAFTHIFINDYAENKSVVIDTGLSAEIGYAWDVQLARDEDLLICRYNHTSLNTFAYLNFRRLLSSAPDTASQLTPAKLVEPHIQKVIKLDSLKWTLDGDEELHALLPHNIPNARTGGLVPTFVDGCSYDDDLDPCECLYFIALDIQKIHDYMKNRDEVEPIFPRSSSFLGYLDLVHAFALGTLGKTAIWAEYCSQSGFRSIHLHPVADFDSKTSLGNKPRILEMPIDLGTPGSDLELAFCDERPILAVATVEGEARKLHLFEY